MSINGKFAPPNGASKPPHKQHKQLILTPPLSSDQLYQLVSMCALWGTEATKQVELQSVMTPPPSATSSSSNFSQV